MMAVFIDLPQQLATIDLHMLFSHTEVTTSNTSQNQHCPQIKNIENNYVPLWTDKQRNVRNFTSGLCTLYV